MLDDGLITPQMLIPDIPTRFGGFTPLNFDQEFNGAVPAEQALARSLNIPAVKMLQNYGVPPFYSFLKKSGMNTLTRTTGTLRTFTDFGRRRSYAVGFGRNVHFNGFDIKELQRKRWFLRIGTI
jgi:membrane peptidoglycan carboxypeptidase